MCTRIRSLAALAAAVVLACGPAREASRRTDAVLSDARSDGAPGFHFVPPVAPAPAAEQNDRGLSPVVEIVALTASEPVLASFTGDAVKESGAHYMVHWSTREHPPAAGTTYRIRVLLADEVLGFADAAVAANGRELRFLASQATFGLTGQRTVPIKFRIHATPDDAGDQDGDGIPDADDLCPTVADELNQDADEDGVGDACECQDEPCSGERGRSPGLDEHTAGPRAIEARPSPSRPRQLRGSRRPRSTAAAGRPRAPSR